jgi:hypothetical protein
MLEMLNGKYGEDMKGEYTFVKQLGKSVIDYALMSEVILRDLVDFRIGTEIIISHMPLTITIRNVLDLEESRDLTVVGQTQKLSRYKWRESLKLDFMDTLNDNSSVLCIHGIQSLLQRHEVNNIINIQYFMVKRAGAKMRQSGGNHRGNRHWFDEECIESKWKSREALRVFKENNDEVSRIKYWESRKKYERVAVKKKAAWQTEEAKHINILARHKDAKKIWEAIRIIVNKMDFKNDVKQCDWVKYFDDLYFRKSNSGLVYETQLLGPQYVEELDSDFMKEEIRESVLKMKNNKATGFDGVLAEMWKMFCPVKGGIEILVEMFNKVKGGKGFPDDWKISIICPIYRGRGKWGEPCNYRGISLLSVLCKIYSGILAGRLRD